MISNIQNAKDFQKLACECLNQAFDLVYDVDRNRQFVEAQKVSIRTVWKHNQGTLRTAIVLVHQGIDAFMKAAICNVSPFLLIENKRNEWPTLPNTPDKDFGDLYTIGTEALMYTYCGVAPLKVSKELTTFVEEVRTKRNAIVHGITAEELSPIAVVEMILRAYTHFLGKDSWWLTMRDQYINDPLFGLMDSEYEIASFGRRLHYVEGVLGKGKLSKHLTQDLKSRRYFCPSCKHIIEDEEDKMDFKWAYLKPNQPESKSIFCLACQQTFPVLRVQCKKDGCKGNVVTEQGGYGRICLTCGQEQEDE